MQNAWLLWLFGGGWRRRGSCRDIAMSWLLVVVTWVRLSSHSEACEIGCVEAVAIEHGYRLDKGKYPIISWKKH